MNSDPVSVYSRNFIFEYKTEIYKFYQLKAHIKFFLLCEFITTRDSISFRCLQLWLLFPIFVTELSFNSMFRFCLRHNSEKPNCCDEFIKWLFHVIIINIMIINQSKIILTKNCTENLQSYILKRSDKLIK